MTIPKNKYLNKINIIFFLVTLGGLINNTQAQNKVLSYESYLDIVRNYHPVVLQANILNQQAIANKLMAKGGFDPIISYDLAQKTFAGQEYYKSSIPEIKIPTWYGIEVSAGMQTLNGQRTENDQTLGSTNYFGLNVPLAKNLLIDKRRAALKQANIVSQMAVNERNAIVNDILWEATLTYIEWAKNYELQQVLEQSVAILNTRYNFTKQSYLNGERPAIDSLEAFVALQSVQNEQQTIQLEYQKSLQNLLEFLWQKNNQAYNGNLDFLPENMQNINKSLPIKSLQEWLTETQNNHPDLLIYQNKLASLEVDRQLKFQEMLPKLDFKYNHLGKGYNLTNTAFNFPQFKDNFQYGLKFEMPLRLSAGRAEYKLAKLKIENTTFGQQLKANQLKYKVNSYYIETTQLQQIIDLQKQVQRNYDLLVKAEETRLINGESSLFLINSRQSKAIEAQQKTVELEAKLLKAKATLWVTSGTIK